MNRTTGTLFDRTATPLVSIVTPVYNGAQFLEQLIRSVEGQDYAHIEHTVIDDGSTDGGATIAVLKRHPQVRWWTRENRGQYATLNEGLRTVRGDIFTTISADDWYFASDAISTLVNAWRKAPRMDGVVGRLLCVNECGTPLPERSPSWRWPRSLIYYLPYMQHSAMLINRQRVLDAEVFFNEGYRTCGDRDWYIQLYRNAFRFVYTPGTVATYRLHASQVSGTASHLVTEEWQRMCATYGRSYRLMRTIDRAWGWLNRWRKLRSLVSSRGLGGAAKEIRAWWARKA